MITKKQWLKDVATEAKNIRKHATKEEIGKLNIGNLQSSHPSMCVYGLLTGDCRSDRAQKLIVTCCKKFVESDDGVLNADTFEEMQDRINGRVKDLGRDGFRFETKYFSSVEAYIMLRSARRSGLISYLKGETDKLEL